MIKNIILCADDYAQNPAISQGIINLIAENRLSAISCLVNSPYWLEHANWLKPFIGQIDIGLHFNLTLGSPLGNMPQLASAGSFPALLQILIRSYLFKIRENEVYAELNRQINQFEKALGKPPDFIDGHQHIQCLPIIRRAILTCYDKRLKTNSVWIRNIRVQNIQQLLSNPAAIKKSILYLLGGNIFKKLLTKAHIPHNSTFSGIYNFKTIIPYSELFPQFLREIDNQGVIMCHPGLVNNDKNDPILNTRIAEYNYFMSDSFLKECQQQYVKLSRFYL